MEDEETRATLSTADENDVVEVGQDAAPDLEGRARKLTVQHAPDGTMQAWAEDDEDHPDAGAQARAAKGETERRKATVESMLQKRQFEHRSADTGPVEIREADDGKLHVSGYASVFDRPYDMGFYKETIKRGAFSKTLNERAQVHLLLNHAGLPLASTLNDSLQLREDAIGLRFDATLDPDDPDSSATVRKIRSGLLQQCSFAFQPVRQSWNGDYTERDIQEVSIDRGDVSIVNFGASPATSVSARSALEDFERQAVRHALEMIEHEERAGATFSTANLGKLKAILSLVAAADRSIDQVQEDLSGLIGVKNPDDDHETPTDDGAGDDEDRAAVIIPDFSAHARLALARARR